MVGEAKLEAGFRGPDVSFFYLGKRKPLLCRLWPIPGKNLKEGSLLGHGSCNSSPTGFGADYCRVLSCYAWK